MFILSVNDTFYFVILLYMILIKRTVLRWFTIFKQKLYLHKVRQPQNISKHSPSYGYCTQSEIIGFSYVISGVECRFEGIFEYRFKNSKMLSTIPSSDCAGFNFTAFVLANKTKSKQTMLFNWVRLRAKQFFTRAFPNVMQM